MNWQEFIKQLMHDLRMSGNELAAATGITQPTLNRILNGKTAAPFPATVKQLEGSLHIKIDDRDPNNITYQKVNGKEPERIPFEDVITVNEYPVLATVYAGEPGMLEHENFDETTPFAYNKKGHRCFALKVSGKSMDTTLRDGDTVLVDIDVPLSDGCLVAVKLKNGSQYIKRYYDLNYAFVKLTSDNPEYGVRLIDKNDIVACYRVVSLNFAL
ncbi:MAG: LexA family transcriptional regulator [Ignavibacteriaceae bacterium]